jgi:hypothetical protein
MLAPEAGLTWSIAKAAVWYLPIDDAIPKASAPKLATVGFLTLWFPHIFVWFIQKPEYPRTFRRFFNAWAIFWCGCAVLFFAVQFATGDRPG